MGATDPHIYHTTNVCLHFIVSIVVMLIAARVLEWAGVSRDECAPRLPYFRARLFLLHPLQTESVAYVASRSEVLSVLFYYSAFAIFIYSNRDSMILAARDHRWSCCSERRRRPRSTRSRFPR